MWNVKKCNKKINNRVNKFFLTIYTEAEIERVKHKNLAHANKHKVYSGWETVYKL